MVLLDQLHQGLALVMKYFKDSQPSSISKRSALATAMGLHMDDIHTPTVTSGPTSGPGPANGTVKSKLSLTDLMNEKKRLEEELSALGSVLDSVCYTALHNS